VEVEGAGGVVLVCASTLHGENYQFAAFIDSEFAYALYRRDGAVVVTEPPIAAPLQPFRMELECSVRDDGVAVWGLIDDEVIAELLDSDAPADFTELTSVGFIFGTPPSGDEAATIWLDNLAVTTE
jgi:hypothetical protein